MDAQPPQWRWLEWKRHAVNQVSINYYNEVDTSLLIYLMLIVYYSTCGWSVMHFPSPWAMMQPCCHLNAILASLTPAWSCGVEHPALCLLNLPKDWLFGAAFLALWVVMDLRAWGYYFSKMLSEPHSNWKKWLIPSVSLKMVLLFQSHLSAFEKSFCLLLVAVYCFSGA